MRELDNKELNIVGGAGDPLTDPNSQIMRQIMAGAAQIPVNVPIPKVPMGPTWNGSKG
ncbi:hypothetical protein LZX53_004811 [Salmonella enterica]|uniref:Uncharacterized protein n=5 Tax=Salmonella enterica TaxID=28901 RepID=A0A735G2K8_SALMU|nr:hypothetical protein [Salmonella enterica]EDT0852105.1 hypothetical protein [Salmonella enterica subsp. enterica serovar Berta]EDT1288355.1 hypothetical protein [Salmonella enterica subsp. enterica serovar Manhattan]EDU6028653.1 hypothetical protein [Salmonella enterica subsp. enterica serovar Brazil]EDV6537414.1 hypothetical protein [Salmonella enterica subsp. enterica serovar Virginia]EDW5032943.1 hypothetical protein [Salmonella enterica subsp. enterica serovar Litchfield]EDW8353389.1 h